jgi:hypothetical protein
VADFKNTPLLRKGWQWYLLICALSAPLVKICGFLTGHIACEVIWRSPFVALAPDNVKPLDNPEAGMLGMTPGLLN